MVSRRALALLVGVGEQWYAAVLLAGEAGLRIGEIMALRWESALTSLPHIRRGRVICNADGMPATEGESKHVIYKICRRAQLAERSWHALRHTLATHAARLGVNPWTLQSWLGHKRIDETMRYVHLVEERYRPIPADVLGAAGAETDPEARIVTMLGARTATAPESRPESRPTAQRERLRSV